MEPLQQVYTEPDSDETSRSRAELGNVQMHSANEERSVRMQPFVQVVRSVLWPSEHSPVYFTAGEDAKICAWSILAMGEESAAAKRGVESAAADSSQPQKKRKKHKPRQEL